MNVASLPRIAHHEKESHEHDGHCVVTKSGDHVFEVLFNASTVQVHIFDSKHKAVATDKLSGEALVAAKGTARTAKLKAVEVKHDEHDKKGHDEKGHDGSALRFLRTESRL